MTSTGKDARKWLLDDPEEPLTSQERAAYWEDVHESADYTNVYSLTDCPVLRELIIKDLKHSCAQSVLIPGCGSRVSLQQALISQIPNVHVTCVDFAGVVAIAKGRFRSPQLRYVAADISSFSERSSYDSVVHVTSVVSESDTENREIMANTSAALNPGGLFLGIFPTVYATLDIAYTTKEVWRAEQIDLRASRFNEPKQAISQVFYTPLRLRRIAKESGLDKLSISLFFNDSEYLRSEGARHYDLHDDDAVLYHLYLKGHRVP